jgi:hypothetical protein
MLRVGTSNRLNPTSHNTYGRPASTYLPLRAVVRLTILRSRLEAVRYERGMRLHSLSERAT